MPKKFQLATDSTINKSAKAGTIVFVCTKHDYGCANDDTRATGKHHTSMTLDPEGDYPFFTHPTEQLTEVKE